MSSPFVSGIGRIRFGRVYLRILASFLSFLIPVIAIGTFSYLHAADGARREYITRIGSNLEASAGLIEQALKMAQATCFGFFSNSSVSLFFGSDASGKPETLAEQWRIPNILQRVEIAIGNYADRIFVFADDDDVWVSDGMNGFDFFFEELYRYGAYDGQTFLERLYRGKPVETLPPTTVTGARAAPDRVVPIVMRGTVADRVIVLVLNVSAQEIERTLMGGAVLKTTTFMVLDEGRENILQGAPELRDWTPSARGFVPGTDSETVIDGREYLVSCRSSGDSDWRYFAITPSSDLVLAQNAITRMVIVISIVFIAMSAIFAFFFSSVVYNPIRALRDAVIAGREDPDSRIKDDFVAIRRSFDALRQDGLETRRLVDQWTREYVENAFRFILRGHRFGGDTSLREALESEYRFSGTCYACAVIVFQFGRDWYRSVLDSERLAVSGAAKDALLSLVEEKVRIVSLELRQDRIAVIGDLPSAADSVSFGHALREALRSFAFDQGDLSVTVGIGRCRASFDELSQAWDEAMTAAARCDEDSQTRIAEYAGAEVAAGPFYTPLDEQELLNALKEDDLHRIEATVLALFDLNEKKGADRGALRVLHGDLLATGRRFLAERGIPPGEPSSREWIEGAEETWGIQEYRHDVVERLLCVAHSGSQASSGGRKGGLAGTISRYVESHYDHGLCLERIADELGVSAKYVSKVFKEMTGENLTDYIDRVRIVRAKELLLTTSMPISEVSSLIGIDSRATFLRVFRRVEGSTPSEYREKFGGQSTIA